MDFNSLEVLAMFFFSSFWLITLPVLQNLTGCLKILSKGMGILRNERIIILDYHNIYNMVRII